MNAKQASPLQREFLRFILTLLGRPRQWQRQPHNVCFGLRSVSETPIGHTAARFFQVTRN
jgi:hypothetical protein